MPINFTSGVYYFPFEQMFEKLYNISYSYQYHKYLEDWESLLMSFEEKSKNEYIQVTQRMCKYNKSNLPYEYFQYSQVFPQFSVQYHYHFDIEQIRKHIDFNNYQTAFSKKFAKRIVYNKIKTNGNVNLKDEPIILVPFFAPDLQYVLIDGNLRLSQLSRCPFKKIKYCIFYPLKKDAFLLSIDWGMYWFSNEISMLVNGSNIDEDIQKSIIYSDFF